MDTQVRNVGRELQVPKQLDELQAALEELDKSISSLCERLCKVSQPRASQLKDVASTPSQGVSMLCEIAANLAEKSNMVGRLRDTIQSLGNCLEV